MKSQDTGKYKTKGNSTAKKYKKIGCWILILNFAFVSNKHILTESDQGNFSWFVNEIKLPQNFNWKNARREMDNAKYMRADTAAVATTLHSPLAKAYFNNINTEC